MTQYPGKYVQPFSFSLFSVFRACSGMFSVIMLALFPIGDKKIKGLRQSPPKS